jgi:hypothetical protein
MIRKAKGPFAVLALSLALAGCGTLDIVKDPDPIPNDKFAHYYPEEKAADKADDRAEIKSFATAGLIFAGAGVGIALQPAPTLIYLAFPAAP